MPYRRLPKTDAARLKALKTLLDNNEIYTVRNRFIDWQTLNKAQPAYDRLLTACEQYRLTMAAQIRNRNKMERSMQLAQVYLSHFIRVLLMSVERGEIKKQNLALYGLSVEEPGVPNMVSIKALTEWGKKIVEGETARLKKGGRPIYNPSIGMVNTHYDIFLTANNQQQELQNKTKRAAADVDRLRPEVDEILLDLWNQIEKHFENEPPEVRFKKCREFGVVYYYRRHEPHDY